VTPEESESDFFSQSFGKNISGFFIYIFRGSKKIPVQHYYHLLDILLIEGSNGIISIFLDSLKNSFEQIKQISERDELI